MGTDVAPNGSYFHTGSIFLFYMKWLLYQLLPFDFSHYPPSSDPCTLSPKTMGWLERIALKHVYYHVWNRSSVQVWCMRQGAQCMRQGAQCIRLGWPWGMGWGGRWEGRSGCGTHIHPWLIHANVWQKPPQYCKVISLQLSKFVLKTEIKNKWTKKTTNRLAA